MKFIFELVWNGLDYKDIINGLKLGCMFLTTSLYLNVKVMVFVVILFHMRLFN